MADSLDEFKLFSLGMGLEAYILVRFKVSNPLAMVNLNKAFDYFMQYLSSKSVSIFTMQSFGWRLYEVKGAGVDKLVEAFKIKFPSIRVIKNIKDDGEAEYFACGLCPRDKLVAPMTGEEWQCEFAEDSQMFITDNVVPEQDKLLTIKEIINSYGEEYHIKKSTWYRYVKQGNLRSQKVGAKVLVSESDLLAFLNGKKK